MSKSNREKLSDVLWSAGIFDHEYGDKIIELFDEERRIAREEEAYRWFNEWYAYYISPAKRDGDTFGKWASERLQEMGAETLTTPITRP